MMSGERRIALIVEFISTRLEEAHIEGGGEGKERLVIYAFMGLLCVVSRSRRVLAAAAAWTS
jgi:uncharacterized membrane protein YqjE